MTKKKEKLFSVTISDCRVETFTVGGHGGAGKDTSNTGVRITHPPSGARGEAREARSQLQNKRNAFKRMADSAAFRSWVRLKAAELSTGKTVEQRVEEEMESHKLLIEGKDEQGRWIPLVSKS